MKTLLIAGFGDIARRALPQLRRHFAVIALVRPEHRDAVATAFAHATTPDLAIEPGDLDQPQTLARFAGRASHVLHTAPPPRSGSTDTRTERLLAMLAQSHPMPERLVYLSTSGVYGDCGGAWVSEDRPANPRTDRARRRLDAEARIEAFCRDHAVRRIVLRVPGIYAADRLPLQRLRNATPVLCAEDDVYTNHIHADDLAAIVVQALVAETAQGIYNACDDSELRMGEWFDLLADRAQLPRPPRIARGEAADRIPPALASFMGESRRLSNRRLKQELGVRLRYPTVREGVPAATDGREA